MGGEGPAHSPCYLATRRAVLGWRGNDLTPQTLVVLGISAFSHTARSRCDSCWGTQARNPRHVLRASPVPPMTSGGDPRGTRSLGSCSRAPAHHFTAGRAATCRLQPQQLSLHLTILVLLTQQQMAPSALLTGVSDVGCRLSQICVSGVVL